MMCRVVIFLFVSFLFLNSRAQNIPYLERTVSLDMKDRSVAEVFKSLSDQTGVVFSYTQFNDQRKVTVNCYRKPLRIVLGEILSASNCMYKSKEKYIIIKCSETPLPSIPAEISGYVYNATDSSKIDRASIYIEETKRSSLTNEYGYFIISCPEATPKVQVSIAKENYYDTTIAVFNPKKNSLVVYLNPKPVQKNVKPFVVQPEKKDSLSVKTDSVILKEDYLAKFRKNFKTFNTNVQNIADTFFTHVSVSFLPYVSTNRFLSANTVNDISFNILAGYSKGVNLMEIGGIVNVDDGNVKYFQMAGVGNVVSGKLTGFQAGGIFNINHLQTNGMQVAGIYNQTQRLNGWQVSGLMNYADTVRGCQLAGFLNEAKDVKGVQVAGFLNRSKKVSGVQVGFLNVSDSCTGVPLGFFSFVKHGYHKIGLETDELGFGTFVFGSGSNAFYNIFSVGTDLKTQAYWAYGYGIGSGYKFSDKWNLAFEATARHVQPTRASGIYLNLLNRFYLGVEFSPWKRVRLSIGPSYNIMVADTNGAYFDSVQGILPSRTLYNHTTPDVNVKMWIGGAFSLKFL